MPPEQGFLGTVDEPFVKALAWHALDRTGGFDSVTAQRATGALPLVYIDKNPWGRHLDDQTVVRNASEAEAFARLKKCLEQGSVRLAYSSIAFGEGSPRDGSESVSRQAMLGILGLRSLDQPLVFHAELTDTAAVAQIVFEKIGIGGQDPIHAAAAILEGAWYFVTGDDRLRHGLNRLYDEWGLPVSAQTPTSVMVEIDAGCPIR
jgi:hypothetical protein